MKFVLPSALEHQAELWCDQTQDLRIAMVGPLGCGKSYALAIKALLLARANSGMDGMLVTPTHGMAELVHEREWPLIWESLGVKVHVGPDSFTWPKQLGSKLWIRSAEAPERLAGPNLAFVLYDEPGQQPREAWERGSVRARHPLAPVRQVVAAGTPEGINWFADEFSTPRAGYRTIWARGWHESLRSYRDQIRSAYGHDASLFAAYGRGQFVPLRVGRAYPAFVRTQHVVPVEYERCLDLVLACDFNVHAMRWLVLQVAPHEIRVLDEIALGEDRSTAAACRTFLERWNGGFHRGNVIVVGDASGQARHSSSSHTDYAVIREELSQGAFASVRMQLAPSNPPVKERIDAVNYHLAGRGLAVRIAQGCTELITDLERVAYREGSTELDKRDAQRTHASDAFGYAVWQLAKPRAQVKRSPIARVEVARSTADSPENWR